MAISSLQGAVRCMFHPANPWSFFLPLHLENVHCTTERHGLFLLLTALFEGKVLKAPIISMALLYFDPKSFCMRLKFHLNCFLRSNPCADVKLCITTMVIYKNFCIIVQLVCQYCPSKLICKASCTRFQLVIEMHSPGYVAKLGIFIGLL